MVHHYSPIFQLNLLRLILLSIQLIICHHSFINLDPEVNDDNLFLSFLAMCFIYYYHN